MGHASRLFDGAADQTLISRISPTHDQREFLQAQWNDLADFIKTDLLDRHGYRISTWLQGSYKFGTLIKPLRPGEEYDVDVGVYFEWASGGAEPTAAQLRTWMQASLLRYAAVCSDVKQVEEPTKQRCSRVAFAKQFHIDTPVYHLETEDDVRRLAALPNKWELRDPKPIYKWFKGAVMEENREQLRRVVRYLKAWAALAFEEAEEARPSSIFMTVVATQAYQKLWPSRLFSLDRMPDDDTLIAVVKAIHERLFEDKEVVNPIDDTEDLNRIPSEHWGTFLTQLEALHDVVQTAEQATDEASAALAWSEAFSFLMPLPEAEAIEILDEGSQRSVMQVPEISIDVYTRKPRQYLTRHRNEVPGVGKDCDLEFRITNPEIVPPYATVEWTVRNEGDEADARSDLGHRSIGVRLLEASEHTAYIGRHFMDCVIRLNGSVYAVRRVPVTIRDVRHQLKPAPKPAHTRLKIGHKRR